MSGTGKRADHRKTLVINQTGGNNYFGKQKTWRKPIPERYKVINLKDIQLKYGNKKEVDLLGYKILGSGELTSKLTIKASAFSESAKEKIQKSGSILIAG